MMDADGNPFSERLVNFLDDYVNDPRKTEEDITQLLSNIRPDMEIPEEERGETPEAMRYPLYAHQQLALKWMTDMEEGTNKGGILADDMGLGKTISTLALMVSRPSSDRNIKTNLIVGPVALIKQWEQEVRTKLKAAHKLSVLLLHQKKKPYSEIKKYDVVLTTYGSLASEWRRYIVHVQPRKESPQYDEEGDTELAKLCPLLHARSKFYRVILDEAQCIKNRNTQGSLAAHKISATYRWCLTGTPMMNGVSELYPLVRFLKIRPYCEFKVFQRDFRNLSAKGPTSDFTRDKAMRKLQAVLKAIMLRRTKSSTIDGKPILTLPEKTQNDEYVTFNEDERQFYHDIESRSKIVFNRYLRAGTVGKNYSDILVLLLRLRQACCHPHLMEFESAGNSAPDSNQMLDLAKKLDAAVVQRVKGIDAFECCICFDAVADPVLIFPCGHDTCPECFTSLTEDSAQSNIRFGEENGAAKCPVCRGPVEPTKVINLTAFRKVHAPDALGPDDAESSAELTDSDDSDDSDTSSFDDENDSDVDSFGNLAGFVVPDGEVEDVDDDDLIDAELDAAIRTKNGKEPAVTTKAKKLGKKKAKKSKADGESRSKSKKSEQITPQVLKKLRMEANKNKDARRRYMHYLRDNWEDSAKLTQIVDLLRQIQETGEKTIVFSQWTSLLDLVEVQVKYTLRLRYRRYTGGMSRNQRDEAVRDFSENPATRVMLVSLRAGNAGLNLTAASRVIICDPFWNPYIEMQAVDRAHRIGQAREVRVHRVLVGGTVEDRIVELQESKRRLVDAALDEGQSKSLGRLSEQELAYLFGVSPPPPAQEDAAAGSAANAAAGSTAGATAGRAGRS
ncbi:f785f566-b04f-4de8-b33a-3f32fa42f9e3 [Thermothielavioides terrestris]|uniref:F785f566-b04f-4de8-b33a-3f32fa42f9e3 n=1 Tax=Thermothielavioides terrestris TaxID=2587410 RepID=A0A446B9E5_9PEZI|nr:f785f566-b04f-4de8-b33a-3f32fa42f9e3 [Thermothielavioides terrestris]